MNNLSCTYVMHRHFFIYLAQTVIRNELLANTKHASISAAHSCPCLSSDTRCSPSWRCCSKNVSRPRRAPNASRRPASTWTSKTSCTSRSEKTNPSSAKIQSWTTWWAQRLQPNLAPDNKCSLQGCGVTQPSASPKHPLWTLPPPPLPPPAAAAAALHLAPDLAVILNGERDDADHVLLEMWGRRWSSTETKEFGGWGVVALLPFQYMRLEREVLNSQLTLHLCALWGTGCRRPSQRALTLPGDANVTLAVMDTQLLGPWLSESSLISWFISSLAQHFRVPRVDLELRRWLLWVEAQERVVITRWSSSVPALITIICVTGSQKCVLFFSLQSRPVHTSWAIFGSTNV